MASSPESVPFEVVKMGNLGWTEIIVILVIALIIFGPRKLPELGKSLGESLRQFRRASEDFKRTWEEEVEIEKRREAYLPPVDPYRDPDEVVARGSENAVEETTETTTASEEAPAEATPPEVAPVPANSEAGAENRA